jgi:hypothetical protein
VRSGQAQNLVPPRGILTGDKAEGEGNVEVLGEPSANGDNGLAKARDCKGRFLPGNPGGPGNPQACNVATWRKTLAEAVSAEDITQVVQRLVAAAKAGEPWAVRELLDRLLGKPHVQIELQADMDEAREYDERLAVEASRLARLALEEMGDRAMGLLPAPVVDVEHAPTAAPEPLESPTIDAEARTG